MNCKNELDRYLRESVTHLLTYCDEVRVQDDGSEDGSFEWLLEQEGVVVRRNPGPAWSTNEGMLHQSLLDFTLEGNPTHVLAIDADELVPLGWELRQRLEASAARTFTLRMCEIWKRDALPWQMRIDGGWRDHPVAVLYRAPTLSERNRADWKIWGRKMAGGRVPRIIRGDHRQRREVPLDFDILHLGWSNPEERFERYSRYALLDGGRFHAKAHLDSILWPDWQIKLEPYPLEPLETLRWLPGLFGG